MSIDLDLQSPYPITRQCVAYTTALTCAVTTLVIGVNNS